MCMCLIFFVLYAACRHQRCPSNPIPVVYKSLMCDDLQLTAPAVYKSLMCDDLQLTAPAVYKNLMCDDLQLTAPAVYDTPPCRVWGLQVLWSTANSTWPAYLLYMIPLLAQYQGFRCDDLQLTVHDLPTCCIWYFSLPSIRALGVMTYS
jgi:hypothetical protein